MQWIDEKFYRFPLRYVAQCLLATAAIMVVLALMDAVTHTALIAALGASTFIAFTMPELRVSLPRFLVGSYFVGIVVGVPLGLVHRWQWLTGVGLSESHSLILLGGLAVGLAIFLMTITNTEHPPAAGVALGLVVNIRWDVRTVVVLVAAICCVAAIKRLIRPYLKNLL